MVAFFSVMVVGCTGDKVKVDYTINGSGWVTLLSGSIALKDSTDIAYINGLTGSVMLDSVAAIHGAILHENSLLVTWSGAEVEIIFVDNSVVRLSQNSRLQISKKWTDNTTLDLQEWTLWSRILKPFTDASFFTLETDDLSAWVRGTSVWLMTDSGWTDIGIVDTTSTGWASSWALVDIVDKAYFWTGDIHLSEEDILRVRHSKPLEHKKMKLREQIKMHPFIAVNTIRDIKYMNSIIEGAPSQTGTMDRIQREMEVTMPTPDEVKIFLTDPIVRSSFESRELSGITPSILIKYLDIENQIQTIKESKTPDREKTPTIEEMRKLLQEIPLTPMKNPENTESTGVVTPVVQPIKTPVKVISTSRTIVPSSTVSGERTLKTATIPCIPRVSGEPCK